MVIPSYGIASDVSLLIAQVYDAEKGDEYFSIFLINVE